MQGGQVALLDALEKTGKPMIVVLVNSKPLVLPPSVKRASAILEGFNPGMEGGRAIAEAILGKINPSGKLTISFPLHVGQQPVFYNQVRGQHGTRYADLTQDPLFPFGHGLSYTSFEYRDLNITRDKSGQGAVTVSFTVKNAGIREGSEIAQVYVQDVECTVPRPVKELKGFRKVSLKPGQQTTIRQELRPIDFSYWNPGTRKWQAEPGVFRILVGSSSKDVRLTGEVSLKRFGTP